VSTGRGERRGAETLLSLSRESGRRRLSRRPNGAYIASVTSADDELDLTGLSALYEQHPAGDHITRYTATGHYFYVLNSGNAVNFLHGACVGPFIYLVQAEILAALSLLAAGDRDRDCTSARTQSAIALRAPGSRSSMGNHDYHDQRHSHDCQQVPGHLPRRESGPGAPPAGPRRRRGQHLVPRRAARPRHLLRSRPRRPGRRVMVKHRVLDMWLIPAATSSQRRQPPQRGAPRTREETGVSWEDIVELPDADAIPVDIDVHPIPANPARANRTTGTPTSGTSSKRAGPTRSPSRPRRSAVTTGCCHRCCTPPPDSQDRPSRRD